MKRASTLLNPLAYLSLLCENNPVEMAAALQAQGLGTYPADPDTLYNAIVILRKQGKGKDLIQAISSVPFICENHPEYAEVFTGDVLKSDTAQPQTPGGSSGASSGGNIWETIIGTAGSVLSNWLTGGNAGTETPPAPETEKNNTIWWILGGIFIIAIIALIILLRKK